MAENRKTGILRKRESKKGVCYEVEFQGRKKTVKMPVPQAAKGFSDSDARDGMEVEIELNRTGQLETVTIPGTLPPPSGSGDFLGDATAPYNFVPYDHSRVITGFDGPDLSRAGEEGFSGSITCTLEALTPILVAGPGESGKDEKGITVRSFFRVDGKPVIPGSSIKGVIRSLLEAMSFSRLRPVNDRALFWRDLRNSKYQERFVLDRGGKPKDITPKYRAGFLYKEGSMRYIRPCKCARVEHDDLAAFRKGFLRKGGYSEKADSWGPDRRIRFDLQNESAFLHCKGKLKIHYAKATDLGRGEKHGELVFTGKMPKKHQEFIFYDEDGDTSYDVSERTGDDKKESLYDRFRAQLTEEQEKKLKDCVANYGNPKQERIPVFFLTNKEGGVEFFGLAALFRMPYNRSVADLLRTPGPEAGLDFCERLFGRVGRDGDRDLSLRGRVAFGHAVCLEEKSGPGRMTTVLGQPQATCAAHYLMQGWAQVKAKANQKHEDELTNVGLSDYNDPKARIRGRKMYWHRELEPVPPPNENRKVAVVLDPLGPGSRFRFRIHVDRLTKEELGGLLCALDLPEGHAHKLGMGKSMGLGSVRIRIEEMDVRPAADLYRSLSARVNGDPGAGKDAVDRRDLVRAFKGLIVGKLGPSPADPDEAYEALPEIRAIRVMTDYENRPQNQRTRMMPLERKDRSRRKSCRAYQEKAILPDATKVPEMECRDAGR